MTKRQRAVCDSAHTHSLSSMTEKKQNPLFLHKTKIGIPLHEILMTNRAGDHLQKLRFGEIRLLSHFAQKKIIDFLFVMTYMRRNRTSLSVSIKRITRVFLPPGNLLESLLFQSFRDISSLQDHIRATRHPAIFFQTLLRPRSLKHQDHYTGQNYRKIVIQPPLKPLPMFHRRQGSYIRYLPDQ